MRLRVRMDRPTEQINNFQLCRRVSYEKGYLLKYENSEKKTILIKVFCNKLFFDYFTISIQKQIISYNIVRKKYYAHDDAKFFIANVFYYIFQL